MRYEHGDKGSGEATLEIADNSSGYAARLLISAWMEKLHGSESESELQERAVLGLG